nr:transposase [Arthrobacter sp. MYb227]
MKITLIDEHCGSAATVRKTQRPEAWTRNIEYVSIEMSSEFRKAIHKSLPEVKFSVDAFHIVQCHAHDLLGHRGRNIGPAYECRKLLTRKIENLSQKQTERRKEILESDSELAVIYAIKEHVRDLLKTSTLESFAVRWTNYKPR